jgi:hypothetical protein
MSSRVENIDFKIAELYMMHRREPNPSPPPSPPPPGVGGLAAQPFGQLKIYLKMYYFVNFSFRNLSFISLGVGSKNREKVRFESYFIYSYFNCIRSKTKNLSKPKLKFENCWYNRQYTIV